MYMVPKSDPQNEMYSEKSISNPVLSTMFPPFTIISFSISPFHLNIYIYIKTNDR